MLWLELAAQRFPLRPGETTLGRSLYCTVVVGGRMASREHATIVVRGEQALLSDANSRNGTFLNGALITAPVPISAGDVIGIGSSTMRVVELSADEDAASTTAERNLDEASLREELTTLSDVSSVPAVSRSSRKPKPHSK